MFSVCSDIFTSFYLIEFISINDADFSVNAYPSKHKKGAESVSAPLFEIGLPCDIEGLLFPSGLDDLAANNIWLKSVPRIVQL